MRIAVCTHDIDERHHISRMLDESLPAKGFIPKISLFPLPSELLEHAAKQPAPFDVVLLSGHREDSVLQQLCRLAPVILVGEQTMAPVAFDVGAAYFIESPVEQTKLERALNHCIESLRDCSTTPRLASRYRRRY